MTAWASIIILGFFPFIYKAQNLSEISNLVADNSTLELTNSTAVSNVTFDSTSLPKTILATTPFIATTTEKDDWSPAENYLYTGDSTMLEILRCNRAYSPTGQDGPLPYSFDVPLRPAMDALANTANFLNMIYQASDLRESTVEEDMEWYHALVRALLDADVLIQKAYLTFDADPAAQMPQLVLRATRNPMAKIQTIILQDLSKYWDTLHPPAPAPDDTWFRSLKFPMNNRPIAALSKRVLLNDLSTLDTPKWRQSDSYVTNRSGVRWASAPFLDCEDGRFLPGWMLSLSAAYYGLKPDLTPEFRGVIRVDVNIQDIDVNQCATGKGWFADTHQCNRTSMECVPISGRGFRLGQYCCRCKEGFYNPELTNQDPDALPVNSSDVCYPSMPVCLPCFPGCDRCQDGTPCRVQEDWLLRTAVLGIQGVFMGLIFVSMMAAYRHRRNKRIRASGLLLLEIILFGSLLLYFPVFIMYFRPSTFRCILLRWVRMLGFSIVYGTVTLKMYRVLKVFLSRTAQRVPYMSSLHLMRILAVMLMTVSWFLCAWTVGVLQNRDRNIPVYLSTTTSDGQGFNLCYLDRWDYMMAVAELLFLCWGSSLWTAVRPVPSAFHEPRYMGIAIHNELLLSTMFHLFRFTFPSLHPDWMLLLCFTHTHFTITVTLALLFLPKFLYVSKPGREEIAAEVYEDEVDLRRSYLNNSFTSAWSEHSVDPEDFREELKKLYAQLEVHKTKKMTANNPHLPKKRSSRCAIGRSIIKRIAEFPETVSRQCSREDKDGSFRSRSICHSDSFRRSPDNVSISYRSSILTPTPSIRKSQSDHHSVQENQPSLRDTSRLRPDMIKRCSQRSETDSLDMTPGVCKSASAQNLTIDTNLLYPDHTRLHKTWSLTTTPTHSVENITKVERSNSFVSKSREFMSIGEQTRSALQSESFDRSEICPWEVELDHSTEKNQKHVTIANSTEDKGGENMSPASPVALVCPWDHLPPPVEKKPSEDLESPKPQLTVSASAPPTPQPKVFKDHRVFSFRTATTKWLSVKSFVESIDSTNKSDTLSRDDSQKSHDGAAAATSRFGMSSSTRRPSDDKKTLQKRSMTTIDGKPNLVKQNAIRLSSGDSSDRSPIRLAVVRSTICPWDIEDVQREAMYENINLSRQNSKRSSGSSWDTASHSRTPSMHRRGSKRLTPARKLADSTRQQSFKAEVCPWEVSEKVNICPWESQEQEIKVTPQGSGRGDVCPWETQGMPATSAVHKEVQAQPSLKRSADICPWESAEPQVPVIRQDSEYANVCPWESPEVVYENLNPMDSKGSLKVPQKQPEIVKATLFPDAQKDSHSKSPVHLGVPMSKMAESCPWDFPDPPPVSETICPWEEGSIETLTVTKKDSTTQMTIKVDVCPWENVQQESLEDAGEGRSSNRHKKSCHVKKQLMQMSVHGKLKEAVR
ncbi:probable G-protein coupled receptor 158 [Periophthalmus magnuspinnatus]|uniref:probable G-protein coupled receptor 158 n=1 Tax=Periophthalmus magnuspinnatus TaxID=409849 RepID=UPI002436B02F|nr:probable G-protein coupled receptor 158 [Periophthalmus magnuspinnatus]